MQYVISLFLKYTSVCMQQIELQISILRNIKQTIKAMRRDQQDKYRKFQNEGFNGQNNKKESSYERNQYSTKRSQTRYNNKYSYVRVQHQDEYEIKQSKNKPKTRKQINQTQTTKIKQKTLEKRQFNHFRKQTDQRQFDEQYYQRKKRDQQNTDRIYNTSKNSRNNSSSHTLNKQSSQIKQSSQNQQRKQNNNQNSNNNYSNQNSNNNYSNQRHSKYQNYNNYSHQNNYSSSKNKYYYQKKQKINKFQSYEYSQFQKIKQQDYQKNRNQNKKNNKNYDNTYKDQSRNKYTKITKTLKYKLKAQSSCNVQKILQQQTNNKKQQISQEFNQKNYMRERKVEQINQNLNEKNYMRDPKDQKLTNEIKTKQQIKTIQKNQNLLSFQKDPSQFKTQSTYSLYIKSLSSSNLIKTQKFTCPICEYQKDPKQATFLCQCNHQFCSECLLGYATIKIKLFQQISCPDEDCKFDMSTDSQFFKMLPKALRQKYQKIHEFNFYNNDPFIKHCPKNGCEGKMAVIDRQPLRCLICGNSYCKKCNLKEHKGSCEDKQFELYFNALKYKKCRCGIVIERVQGCPHMTCRCGYQFCYICGTQWTSGHVHRAEVVNQTIRQQINYPRRPTVQVRNAYNYNFGHINQPWQRYQTEPMATLRRNQAPFYPRPIMRVRDPAIQSRVVPRVVSQQNNSTYRQKANNLRLSMSRQCNCVSCVNPLIFLLRLLWASLATIAWIAIAGFLIFGFIAFLFAIEVSLFCLMGIFCCCCCCGTKYFQKLKKFHPLILVCAKAFFDSTANVFYAAWFVCG